MLETNDSLCILASTQETLQGHLTRLPQLSAGAPIDPVRLWCEGPLKALEAGASQPRRLLSAYNALSAGGSPPPYPIQSHNAVEPGGGNRIWFVCWLILEKNFFPYTPPASPSLACLLFFCQPPVLLEQMQKASSKRDPTKNKRKKSWERPNKEKGKQRKWAPDVCK